MLMKKINETDTLKIEDNKVDTQESEFASRRRHAGERQYHK